MGRAGELAGDDVIAYEILVATQKAVSSLKNLSGQADDTNAWLHKLYLGVAELNAKLGQTPVNATKSTTGIERLNIAWANLKAKLDAAKVANHSANEEIKKTPAVAKSAESALGAFFSRMGAILTSHLILATFKAIVDFFQGVFQAATEYRGKMAELNFAEAVLSKKGMDITRAELDTIISDIENKFKFLSTLEATGVVSTIASMGAEFKLTKENVVGLSEAVAFLQLKEKAYGMEVSKAGSIVNAALDGRSNYFNALGINITKTAIKEKVYSMGLVESGKAITKEMSNQAAIALLIEQTADKYDELITSIEKVDPALARELKISKEMKDVQVEVGKATLEVKDAWNSFLVSLIDSGGFDSLKDSLIVLIQTFGSFIGLLTDGYRAYVNLGNASGESGSKLGEWIGPVQTLLTLLQLIFFGFTTIVGAVVTAMGILSEFFSYASGAKSYEEAGKAIGQHFSDGLLEGIAIGLKPLVSGKDDPIANSLRKTMELLGKDISTPVLPDTPTGDEADPEKEIEENAEDIAGALEKANDEILKANLKLEQDLQDIAIDLGRKMVDITTEYAQKRADVERDYANKIGDINRDTQNKIADINRKSQESKAKFHADQLEKEREFQNKLKEMQEDFLMDLDDALHARDARAILKLIKQYELEKLQAERKHGLDQTNSKKDEQLRQQSYAAERKEAEEEGRAKLADAQRDYALKMAKLKADEEAEVKAAVLAANRKTEDTLKANNDRLAIIAADLVNQFNLTKAGLDDVLALYQMYYGDGGFISQVMAGMNSTLAGQQNLTPGTSGGATGGTRTGQRSSGGGTQHHGMAEGGTIIANRPTTVTFGEAGLEEASFRPIGRTGMDVNKIFSALGSSGGDGSNGMVTIALDLSPDIEARITKNTMNKTAQIITKTRRSK